MRIARSDFDGGGAEVHELTQRELASGVKEEEAVDRFVRFAGKSPLEGHYVAFDVTMVQNALERLSKSKLDNTTFDTMEVMMKKFPEGLVRGRKSWPLGICAERYGLANVNTHTALGHAHMTALLFLALKKEKD